MGWLRSLKHKLLLASKLSAGDWLALVEAWWVLMLFFLALRWMSFKRLEDSVHNKQNEAISPRGVQDLALRLHSLVGYASRMHLLSMTCLVRTFTLRWMLGRRGIPAQIKIGANKSAAGVHAHAWLEIGGQMIGEPEDIPERFKVLSSV